MNGIKYQNRLGFFVRFDVFNVPNRRSFKESIWLLYDIKYLISAFCQIHKYVYIHNKSFPDQLKLEVNIPSNKKKKVLVTRNKRKVIMKGKFCSQNLNLACWKIFFAKTPKKSQQQSKWKEFIFQPNVFILDLSPDTDKKLNILWSLIPGKFWHSTYVFMAKRYTKLRTIVSDSTLTCF